jgi:hypothetical protein
MTCTGPPAIGKQISGETLSSHPIDIFRADFPLLGLVRHRKWLPCRHICITLRIVEHAEAHLFEVGNARRQKRSAPTTPRGSKTAHADFLTILSSLCPKISAQPANGRLFVAAAHRWA